MDRINITSGVLRTVWFFGFVIAITALPAFIYDALSGGETYKILNLIIPPETLPARKALLVAPHAILLLTCAMIAFFASKVFMLFAKGEIFSSSVVKSMKAGAYICLAGTVLHAVAYSFAQNVSLDDLYLLEGTIAGLVIIVFSWVIEEGVKHAKS